MTTATETDLLRPLAEMVVACPEFATVDILDESIGETSFLNGAHHSRSCKCHGTGTIPDPRFASLRFEADASGSFGYLDTSLGAIARAAAACGFVVQVWAGEEGLFGAALTLETFAPMTADYWTAVADTPELAATNALVAAVA